MPMTSEQLETFPESVRDWDEIKNSDTPENAWDRLGNMRTKMGTALFAPGEDAGEEGIKKFNERAVEISDGTLMPRPDLEDDEQRGALFKALGRPDEAAGYEFADVEGSELNEDRKAFLGKIAHEAGLSKAQLKALDEAVRTQEVTAFNALSEQNKSDMRDLKQEWGLTFEDRIHMAKKVAKSFFSHIPEDTILSAHELRSFHALGKQLGGNSREFQEQGDPPSGNDPQEARSKIAEIRGNPDHPYFDQQKPGHKEARLHMRKLYKQANNIPVD